MTARHRQLDLIAHRADRAANTVPDVLDHLDEQRANVAPIGAHPTDTGGTSTGGHGDPTLRTLMELEVIAGKRATIIDAIATLNVCMNMLESACREALGYRTPDAHPQPACIGSHIRTVCWNIPVPRRLPNGTEVDDGRCIECGPQEDARLRAQGDARRLRRQQERMGVSDQTGWEGE